MGDAPQLHLFRLYPCGYVPLTGSDVSPTGRPIAMARNGKKLLAVSAAISAIAGVGLAVAPAQADDLNVDGSAPEISIISQPSDITPTAGTSTGVYTYQVQVSDADTLANLTSVKLCLYAANTDGTPGSGANTSCSPVNAMRTVLYTWTRADDTFVVTPNSRWRLGNPGESYVRTAVSSDADPSDAFSDYDADATTMTMRFTVRVSDVTRQGKWRAVATVTDQQAKTASASVEVANMATVAWYGAVTSPRTAVDWGVMDPGQSISQDEMNTGTYLYNGNSNLMASLTDYQAQGGVHTISNVNSGAPGAGQFSYIMTSEGSWYEGVPDQTQLTSTPATWLAQTGQTAESGSNLLTAAQLQMGSGIWPTEYSNTVTLSVSQGS